MQRACDAYAVDVGEDRFRQVLSSSAFHLGHVQHHVIKYALEAEVMLGMITKRAPISVYVLGLSRCGIMSAHAFVHNVVCCKDVALLILVHQGLVSVPQPVAL